MTNIIPMEVSHLFDWINKAQRFSILPKGLDERFESDLEMQRHLNACHLLFAEANAIYLFDIEWNRQRPEYGVEHVELEKRLANNLSFTKGASNNAILKIDSNFHELEFLWNRSSVKRIFKCAIVIDITWPSRGLNSLFACSSEPKSVQGANNGLRSAINRAKMITKKDGTISALFRGSEVEIFANSSLLPEVFTYCYKNHSA